MRQNCDMRSVKTSYNATNKTVKNVIFLYETRKTRGSRNESNEALDRNRASVLSYHTRAFFKFFERFQTHLYIKRLIDIPIYQRDKKREKKKILYIYSYCDVFK